MPGKKPANQLPGGEGTSSNLQQNRPGQVPLSARWDVPRAEISKQGASAKQSFRVRPPNRRLLYPFHHTSLSEEEIIRLYASAGTSRCSQTCKSYLSCYHPQPSIRPTAHTSIVMVRYMLLALEQRKSVDARSFGELFMLVVDELLHHLLPLHAADPSAAMLDSIRELFHANDEQIEVLMKTFLSRLPEEFQTLLSAAGCYHFRHSPDAPCFLCVGLWSFVRGYLPSCGSCPL